MSSSEAFTSDPWVVRSIFDATDVLLLDFDGPVCAVFARHPAEQIADELRVFLVNRRRGDDFSKIARTGDPFDILRYASTVGEHECQQIEKMLQAYEVDAVGTATPTNGAHELIRKWSHSKGSVGIVSNNSTVAVNAYLRIHELMADVAFVSARTSPNPSLLKPNRHLVDQAISYAGVSAHRCTLVGDSASDILAAHAAGVKAVGYANKPGKLKQLHDVQPDALIDSIASINVTG